MQTPLLFTKLYVPPALPARVTRARLTERLSEGIQPGIKLILLAAPAGSGKTAILSEWFSRSPIKTAWLSLDEGDNEPVRFWDYVVAALQQIDPRIGANALALLHEPTPLPVQSILVVLINELSVVAEPFALVLDDYHVIGSPAIHEGLAFLLERLPPQMHLVMTTRTDPPLPLSRLRARSELLELRARDLQFNAAETAQFVTRLTGSELPGELLQALQTRTEGWAAGLQLAGLALRGHDNPAEFIGTFAGNNRFILDYLGDEVLDKQPPAIQRFLMQTSILGQLNSGLCSALTGEANVQAMLDTLERGNFFLYPVDDKRRWYRYHQLFRDFLQHRLQQVEADQIPLLHRRASEWFEEHGYLDEAIQHSLAIPDYERAGSLVESIAELMIWRRNEVHTLQEWLGALPVSLIASRPRLALYRAWTFYLVSRRDEAVVQARLAEECLEHGSTPKTDGVWGVLYAIQSTLTGIQQDFPAALRTGRLALAHLPESVPTWRCMAAINLGVSSAIIGEMNEAVRTLNHAMELAEEIGSAYAMISAFWHVATLQTDQLHLSDVLRMCDELQRMAEAPGVQRFPVGGYIALLRAEILLERNQLAAAEARFLQSAEEMNPEGTPMALLRCFMGLARLRRAQNDAKGSEEWFRRAEQLERVAKLRSRVSTFAAYRGRRFLQAGDLPAAQRWVTENHLGADNEFNYLQESYYLMLARFQLANARSDPSQRVEALRLLGRMAQRAAATGRAGSLVRALTLQALAQDEAGDSGAAVETLRRVLSMTEPEGMIMTFTEEGPPMAQLIQRVLESQATAAASEAPRPTPEYLSAILAAMGVTATLPAPARKRTNAGLVEQLSERELEVLRLLSDGMSSNEIAAKLIISVETARKHIKNIYGKMDVHSQFEAAKRARELNLI